MGDNNQPDSSSAENYVRSIGDVKSIIKFAKLDEENLTQVTQAIFYPDENIDFGNLKILEADEHILSEIENNRIIMFKGGLHEKVVLCTDEKTYEIKEAEISNSLLLIPDLKFAQATSTSPLKSPRNAGKNTSLERSLDSSTECLNESSSERIIEQRNILKIFHDYYECREIQPKFRKLFDLLQLTRYSGPENEHNVESKFKFTNDQLLATIQCSRKEYSKGLEKFRAIELDEFIRIFELEYEYRILNVMIGLISENSWKLNEIDKAVTVNSLKGIAPEEVVDGLFNLYTNDSDIIGKYKYDEELLSRIIAQNILQPGLKFRIDEFMNTWQEALPEGMNVEEKYLRGLGIVDKDSAYPCIRSLFEENLSTNLQDRLKILFKTRSRWTLNEIEPYIEYFQSLSNSITTILAKHARSLTIDNVRYYVAKHS